jgi:hypothetical protein
VDHEEALRCDAHEQEDHTTQIGQNDETEQKGQLQPSGSLFVLLCCVEDGREFELESKKTAGCCCEARGARQTRQRETREERETNIPLAGDG